MNTEWHCNFKTSIIVFFFWNSFFLHPVCNSAVISKTKNNSAYKFIIACGCLGDNEADCNTKEWIRWWLTSPPGGAETQQICTGQPTFSHTVSQSSSEPVRQSSRVISTVLVIHMFIQHQTCLLAILFTTLSVNHLIISHCFNIACVCFSPCWVSALQSAATTLFLLADQYI